MSNIIIRVIVIYIIVIALLRLMGKRQIGEMEPYELVITLIIADLATIPMAEQTIPIWYGVVPLVAITIIHFIFSFLSQKSVSMRDILSGKPAIVITPTGVDVEELKRLNMSFEELTEQLRNSDYFNLGDINYAIIERNGKITVIPKGASQPLTAKDLKLAKEESDIFWVVIENGKLLKRNLKELEHAIYGSISDILYRMKCSMSDILFMSVSQGGQFFAQKKTGELRNFRLSPDGITEIIQAEGMSREKSLENERAMLAVNSRLSEIKETKRRSK
ncbi:MAG: DUF421 domain-containing protein [Firmicutes bacterium]|nr:DUF421 domain-containing protein [Bacillota bacterium]